MGVYFGKLRVGVELPRYDVVSKSSCYEVRRYHACVAAEVRVETGSQFKGSDGFRALAKYIGAFGTPENERREAIKMTAPVLTQARGERIAMTAPVVSGAAGGGSEGYWMQFIMPSKWTMETLPAPSDERVRLKPIGPRYVAALYFSGRANGDEVVKGMEAKLLEGLRADGLTVREGAQPQLARYYDPFTPGFLRTNEVWVVINPPDGKGG
ncbi:SOUL heme-binding protein [Chloropicon primus]|nr:SOUL heme-binding protein [Chloropicon primus]